MSSNLSDTLGVSDVVIDDEQLKNYFGEIYASKPSKFQFQRGDTLLIKELVEHVKRVVDGGGINSGLGQFKAKGFQNTSRKRKKNMLSEIEENNNCSFRSGLFEKVMEHLRLHDTNLNLNGLDESIVTVFTRNGFPIYGSVACIFCQRSNKKDAKPKRVYYHTGSGGKYWVLSNFTTHLKAHKTKFNYSQSCNAQKDIVIIDNKVEKEVMQQSKESDNSLICVNDEKQNEQNKNIISINLDDEQVLTIYNQLSNQITEVTQAVLLNNDITETMRFKSDRSKYHSLTVAEIESDGNCCFSALAHQLFRRPIHSIEHKLETKNLRKNVVKHILDPQNYLFFEHELRGHIYDLKKADDIGNMDFECKFFVTHCLSKSGTWAGSETIKAVSRLYQVNIIIFNENETSVIIHDKNVQYDRSIAIAYRLSEENEYDGEGNANRNHYDSVCDINSDILYDSVEFLAQQMK